MGMMTSGGRDSRDALFLCVGDASRVDVNVDVVGVDVGMLRSAIFFFCCCSFLVPRSPLLRPYILILILILVSCSHQTLKTEKKKRKTPSVHTVRDFPV